jgi:hypothetical protein
MTFIKKDLSKPWAASSLVESRKCRISWNKLFLSLVNAIYEEQSEHRIRQCIESIIQQSVQLEHSQFVDFSNINAVEQMRFQFEALGLIRPTAKRGDGGTSYIAWSMTDKGRKYVTSMRAMRRKMDQNAK